LIAMLATMLGGCVVVPAHPYYGPAGGERLHLLMAGAYFRGSASSSSMSASGTSGEGAGAGSGICAM